MSQVPNSTTPAKQIHSTNPIGPDGVVRCYCGLVALHLTSNTQANPGREFYMCEKPKQDPNCCKFWKWASELGLSSTSNTMHASSQQINLSQPPQTPSTPKTPVSSSNRTIPRPNQLSEEARARRLEEISKVTSRNGNEGASQKEFEKKSYSQSEDNYVGKVDGPPAKKCRLSSSPEIDTHSSPCRQASNDLFDQDKESVNKYRANSNKCSRPNSINGEEDIFFSPPSITGGHQSFISEWSKTAFDASTSSPSRSQGNSAASDLEILVQSVVSSTSSLQSIVGDVRKLERKVLALEKSNNFKSNRINELEQEIKLLKEQNQELRDEQRELDALLHEP